jgi:hypothetical protein
MEGIVYPESGDGFRRRSPCLVFCAVPDGNQKDRDLAFGVRGEEARHIVVEEGKPGGAEALSVRRQIQLAPENAGFQLHRAISAIAKAL